MSGSRRGGDGELAGSPSARSQRRAQFSRTLAQRIPRIEALNSSIRSNLQP